jgi:hypothetical protein
METRSNRYTIIAFDPGSYNLGMSVSYIEKETFKLIVLHAETLMVNRRLDENSFE